MKSQHCKQAWKGIDLEPSLSTPRSYVFFIGASSASIDAFRRYDTGSDAFVSKQVDSRSRVTDDKEAEILEAP